jgi:putrescine importer
VGKRPVCHAVLSRGLRGFLICGFIWLNLSRPALILGAAWMIAGIAYGAIRTRGFKAELVNFDIPAEDS